MKRRLVIISAILLIFGGIGFIAMRLLPDSSLQAALGLEQLPKSLSNVHTKEQVFTDSLITAYFEASPTDMAAILSARDYEHVKGMPASRVTPQSIYPLQMSKFFPALPEFEVATIYRWEAPSKEAFSILWIDSTHTKAFVQYSVD